MHQGDSKEDSASKNEAKPKTILERLDAGEVIVGDGGYITEMERRGYVTAGLWTPEVNVEHPDAVEGLHKEFARAGSDILQAFTFFAGDHIDIKTSHEGDAINEAACRSVKKVCSQFNCLWAGGLSATVAYKKEGSTAKKKVQDIFRSQTKIFLEHDADLLIAEYFAHCEEAEWAVEVLKETGKPVAASLCIDSKSDYNGVSADECAVRLVRAGADIVGVNCKFDPEESLKAVAKMKEGLQKAGLKTHLLLQPVGFHCPDGGKYGYEDLPEFPFALESRTLTRWDVHKITRKAYDLGVRFIGGCCGFKAYHIRAISEELAEERDRKGPSSEKHKPFAKELFLGDTSGRRTKEFWMKLKPASGRPLCSAFSEPWQQSSWT